MGLLLSIVITYAGFNGTVECLKHIISGVVPATQPDFQDLVEYYTRLLRKKANSSPRDWTECGQGYLHITEEDGRIKSASIKFHGDHTHALLFSTKISSFGQDSIDEKVNGDYRLERYPTKTKTIISESSESFSVGNKKRSPTSSEAEADNRDKLTWEYIPKSASPLPEINFQSYDEDKSGDAYSEHYLRSLDGIRFRPLQRNDPSGRRRTFRKGKSSSSNSSKESRASREEELQMFTSLEEAEFASMSRENNYTGFGSAPNLAARSYSRSRSRERSREKRSLDEDRSEGLDTERSHNLGSFEERDEMRTHEVNEESADVDFWSNIAD
ncbi:unnamed protein product [Leptosia nina]|uniref:Uncharacterized protein n=1 Tax=Leptosia nina TaxID=320188 RepID=A0AAV1JXE7_9NEOP